MNLLEKGLLAGAFAVSMTGCATVDTPPTKFVAGASLTEPVIIEACDAKGFKVWDKNPINMNSLARRGNIIEDYRGHLIEYTDPSYAKVFGLLGLVAGAAGGKAGVAIATGIVGYVGGSKLDSYLTPQQLMELRACKNYLDKVPSNDRYINNYGPQINEPTRRLLNSHLFIR